jgi:hypothetical protein
VRFTTTLGTVTPTDAQTSNGVAVATFNAGTSSGVATIHAVSGGATGGSGTTGGTGTGSTTTVTAGNMVTITVGVAAAKTLTVTASPTSVGPNGGSVSVTAMVLDPSGGSLAGIPVTFSSDHGNMNPGTAMTDAGGQATSTLTTSVETKVTASAGAATGTATVTLRPAPAITVKCTPASGTGTCASVAASDATNTATVTFDVAKATGSSTLRDVTINYGDGTSQSLGTLAGGTITVAHSYPGSSNIATYTAVVTATDLDNERSTVSTIVNVTPRSAPDDRPRGNAGDFGCGPGAVGCVHGDGRRGIRAVIRVGLRRRRHCRRDDVEQQDVTRVHRERTVHRHCDRANS